MLYYANGGPGTSTKLLRVDDTDATPSQMWVSAPAERWEVKTGWRPYSGAQGEILDSGDFFLIDESQVPEVQAQLTARRNEFL